MNDLFNVQSNEDIQAPPPIRDLNTLTPQSSRLSSTLTESTSRQPFTSTSTIPKTKPAPIKTTSVKGPVNLASSIKLVSENSAAKAQASLERESMKDVRAQNWSQAIVDAAKIKHQPFKLQAQAMELFSQGEELHFTSLEDRLGAAQVLRDNSNSAFFIQLSDCLRWVWLKNELHKADWTFETYVYF